LVDTQNSHHPTKKLERGKGERTGETTATKPRIRKTL